MKDYYKILGIAHSANLTQIKHAYRNLIKACHPDVNTSPEAVEWTPELNEAYEVLANPHPQNTSVKVA